nr:MAG TPA: hypothetical protein [Crassvirales sp.]
MKTQEINRVDSLYHSILIYLMWTIMVIVCIWM